MTITTTERMAYSRYKKHYSDCETVRGSYNKYSKSIEVIIPDGRMKPSGVRGRRFWTYQFVGYTPEGRRGVTAIKAVSLENAMKRLPEGYTWHEEAW